MTNNQKRLQLALHCNVILAAPHNYDAMLVAMAEALLPCLEAKPIELPSIDDITIPVELALSANETELFLQQYRHYTIEALRTAGHEVKS